MAAPPASAVGDTLVFAVQPGTQVGSGSLTISKLEVYRTSNGTYYPKAELKCSGATYDFSGPLDLVALKATATNSDLTLHDGQRSGAFTGPGHLYGTFSPALDSGVPVLKVTSWEGCKNYSSTPTDALASTVPPPVPSPFAGCSATSTSSGIDVKWPAQSGVSGYTVTSAPASTTKNTGVNTTAAFAYGELTADTAYTFTVNGAGTGAGVTCTTATVRTLPGAPTGMVDRYGAIYDVNGVLNQKATISMPQAPSGFDSVWLNAPTATISDPLSLLGTSQDVQWPCGSTLTYYPAYVSVSDPARISVGPALQITPPCTVPDVVISNPQLNGSTLTFGYNVASGSADGVTFEYQTRTKESNVTSAWMLLPAIAPASSGGSSTVRVPGIKAPEAVTLSLRAVNGEKKGNVASQDVQPTLPAFRYPVKTFSITGSTSASYPVTPQFDPFPGGTSLSPGAGGLPGLVFTATSPLPKGLKLDPKSGVISGQPGTALVVSVGVTMTYRGDAQRAQSTTAVITYVDLAPPSPKTVTFPAVTGIVGVPLASVRPSIGSGLATPRLFYAAQDLCDAGLAINPTTGEISGSPIAVVLKTTISVRVAADGPGGCVTSLPPNRLYAVSSVSLQVGGNPNRAFFQVRYASSAGAPVSQSAVYNETGVVGTAMTIAPTVYPSGQAATYAVTAGVLPAGLSLDPQTGTISGTPTGLVSGSQVTITATRTSDASGQTLGAGDAATASAILSFTISAQAVTAALAYPNATVAVGHAIAVTPQNTTPGYVYAIVTAPGLPGIVIDSATGRVAWNASYGSAGSHVVTVRETAPGQAPVDVAFTITVTAAPGAIPAGPNSAAGVVADGGTTGSGGASSNAANADFLNPCGPTGAALYADFGGSVNSSLAFAPNLAGLPDPVSFAITSGTLPMGLRLDTASGLIWGTPELANDGRGPVQVSAIFVDGTVRSSDFNIAVDDPHQALNYPVIVRAAEGNALTVTPTSLHPLGRVQYRVVCGTVPAGMRFDAKTGVLAGTPTQAQDGSAPLRVRMIDSYGWVDASLSVVVGSAPEAWLRYPDYARVGIDEKVSIMPVATSLGSDVRFKAKGALPPGFVFNRSTGAFSGTARRLDEIVYEPTVTAYRFDGSIVTKTVVSLNVISPTVPLHVVSHKASRPIPAGKRTTLVSKVRTPSWAFTSTKVACGPGCRAAVNPTTGKVVVSGARKGQRVTVTVIARVKSCAPARYGSYLLHG
ncbi:MAG: Ig domain-containing protein, partial [Actinomycetales bacterium]